MTTDPRTLAFTDAALSPESAAALAFDIYSGLRLVGYNRLSGIAALRVVGFTFSAAERAADAWEMADALRACTGAIRVTVTDAGVES